MCKKLTAIIIATIMMVFGMTACGGGDESDANAPTDPTHLTFVLDWTPNTNHTGIYVAEALGYFEDAGLEVEVIQPPENGVEGVVASGKADFGVSFQDYLVPCLMGQEKQMPVTAVAAIIQHNLSGIMSDKDLGITSPKKMENHSYATWELPIEQAILKECVEEDGGDFSSVEMLPEVIDDEVTALRSKQVDTIWVFYGWAGIAAEVQDFAINYFAFKDIDDAFDYYSPVIIANDEFLADNPDTAKAFLAAVAKGYEYAIENPEEAADILLEANPELDADLVKASQKYLAEQYQADADQWGVFDANRWNKFYQFINEKGLAEQEIPLDTGFTNDYLPEK